MFYCFLFFIFLILWPKSVFALQITEIAYDVVGSDADKEWVELYNETEVPIDLSSAYFFDGTYHVLAVPPERGSRGSLILEAQQYLILTDHAQQFLIDHPDVSSAVIDTVMDLPNYQASRSQPITLSLTNKLKEPMVTASYLPEKSFIAGHTLEHKTNGQWQVSSSIGGTPGQANSPPILPITPQSIRFSELLVDPEGADAGQEWVEIENMTDQLLKLHGSLLLQTQTAQEPKSYSLPAVNLESRQRSVISIAESFLTNQPFELKLIGRLGEVIDSAVIDKPKEGESWAFLEGSWQLTNRLTPSQPNLSRSLPSPTPAQAVKQQTGNKQTAVEPTYRSSPTKPSTGHSAQPLQSTVPTHSVPSSSKASPSRVSKSTPKAVPAKLSVDVGDQSIDSNTTPSILPYSSPSIAGIADMLSNNSQQSNSFNVRHIRISLLLIIALSLIGYLIYRYKLIRFLGILNTLWSRHLAG